MKKKLLITMGCSYTEGMGCYDYSNFPVDKTIYSNGISKSQIKEQTDNFHKLGYPNRLGKKLGYNKVINLGVSGGSTSGQIKKFIENYWNDKFKSFDEVFIFFWLPSPYRFSFYQSGDIIDLVSTTQSGIEMEYLKFVNDIPDDLIKEQVFYLKMMSSYCKSMNFNFLWFADETLFGKSEIDKYPLDNWIGIEYREVSNIVYDINSKLHNKIDKHPNEEGYEFYAENFYQKIKKDFPFLIGNNNGMFDWEYV